VRLLANEEARGQRLDHFLSQQLAGYSRTRIQGWVRAGRVLVNGKPAKASALLRGGEVVEVEPENLPPLRAFAENLPLEILYEDDDLVAVNKPSGMVVHAGAGNRAGTLVNALLHHFEQLSGVGGELRPGIVHRLDRYTSGVILVAKTDRVHRALQAQFSGRRVGKTYFALVHGCVRQPAGRIDRPIARDPVRRARMTARLAAGRSALTEYRVLERFERFTYLEVRIATGRTHQIRVHLSSIGHPVVGDRIYGAPATVEGREPLGRYFLHAHRIIVDSPSTGERLTIEAPLPVALREWMEPL
jgi:23S rRNA pseudouridine1911/1915/1917 synthase